MTAQNDKRVIKTKRAIRDAFFDLTEEHGFEKVTVQMIADRSHDELSDALRERSDRPDAHRIRQEDPSVYGAVYQHVRRTGIEVRQADRLNGSRSFLD